MEKLAEKKKHLSNQRNGGSYTIFMRLSLGTVVNLGLPSLHGGSLEVTITVPFNEVSESS